MPDDIDKAANITELGGHLRGLKNDLYRSIECARRGTYCANEAGLNAIATETTQAIADIEAILKKLEHPQVQEFTAEEEPIPF